MHPLTPAQVILPPRVTTSGGSAAALSRNTGLSVRDLKHHQARNELVHLLSFVSLTKISPLVEAIVGRIYSITQLCAEKRANLKAILLPDRSAPSPDKIKDLLSIARCAERYFVVCGYHITKTMWSEMKNEHYELFYLTVPFAVQNFTDTYVDSSMF